MEEMILFTQRTVYFLIEVMQYFKQALKFQDCQVYDERTNLRRRFNSILLRKCKLSDGKLD